MSDRQFSPIHSLDLDDKDLIRWLSYNLQNKVCEVPINSKPLRALNVLSCKFKNLPLFRWLKTLFLQLFYYFNMKKKCPCPFMPFKYYSPSSFLSFVHFLREGCDFFTPSPQICATWHGVAAATSARWRRGKAWCAPVPQGSTWTPATRRARWWTTAPVT